MKHVAIAVSILAVLLCLCILASAYVRNCAAETIVPVLRAQALAAQENYTAAAGEILQAKTIWHDAEAWLEILLPHDEADEASRVLATLYEYARVEDTDDFSAASAELVFLLEHIRQMQLATLQNIL